MFTDSGLVEAPPTVIWAPQDTVTFMQDSDLTLECAAEGFPVPQISWEKYGGHLPVGRFNQVLGKRSIYAWLLRFICKMNYNLFLFTRYKIKNTFNITVNQYFFV